MWKKIIFATGNEGKMDEVREILGSTGWEFRSLKDMNIDVNIVEDGNTFEENAIIKAKAIMELTGEFVMADDSGLEVDYLDKAPGIYSARYLGEETAYSVKNNHIITLLENAKDNERSARFICAIACVFPDGRTIATRGVVEGLIGFEEKGNHGFGYDPIFFLPEYNCTTAELPSDKKNEISHRGLALKKMEEILKKEGISFGVKDSDCQ